MSMEPFQVLIADDDADMLGVLRHVIDKADGFARWQAKAADGEETMRKFEETQAARCVSGCGDAWDRRRGMRAPDTGYEPSDGHHLRDGAQQVHVRSFRGVRV